ncbi:MAG: Hpt domain-containing protein [Solidesulfovibrio sp.]|uniref:Hpt domain-containing protein n=1 Tax=Solidesulfovibrio sp. TaxID=2910990 RepID=UPI002B1ECC2C|nr:Hpt domain-containing protein [Solidesulfovibrio sp.]MEA4856026.1 Hpt domain-containing protein [Solidesulfovibrio sp.]
MDANGTDMALIDLDRLRQRFDDDMELLSEIFRVFISETPGRRADIEKALAAGDANRLNRLAHSLKGVAATMFAEPLRQAAYAVELAARDGDAARLARLTPELLAVLEASCAHVRGLI